ncbi:MAG: hypothetical protein PUB07_02930 [Clostridia bacterium]|nr:hypothetical protein [Clostridia bacterium]
MALCEKEQDNSNYKRLQKLLKENTRKQKNVASAIAECGEESVRKLMYEQVVKLQNERAEIEKQFAIEKASQVHLTVTDIKFFLKQLQKGKADDMRYRKTLINVFVNAIYLYDDKISFIFNSGDTPITIDDKLLSDIEADNKAFECSFLEQSAPPRQSKVRLTPFLPYGKNIRPLPCSSFSPKANGFSGIPEVLMEKVRISKHLLHQIRRSRRKMMIKNLFATAPSVFCPKTS